LTWAFRPFVVGPLLPDIVPSVCRPCRPGRPHTDGPDRGPRRGQPGVLAAPAAAV